MVVFGQKARTKWFVGDFGIRSMLLNSLNEIGGPSGKQACVKSCPMKTIKLATEAPDQTETDGYDVNLRNEHWLNLGLVENIDTIPPLFAESAKNPRGTKIQSKQ